MIQCKHVKQAAQITDGHRVLVVRSWPGDMPKEALGGQWLPEAAPTADLHRAYRDGEIDYPEFSRRYRHELAANPAYWWPLLDLAVTDTLTLLHSSGDCERNNAHVLAGWLEDELERLGPSSSPVCYAK